MKHLILTLALALYLPTADSCTTFILKREGSNVLGKSYDWTMSHGLVTINKRNVLKQSVALLPTDKAHNWKSKYGSLTFNQYGVEFPNAGLNEKGLGIEIMWLKDSVYAGPDNRGTLNELQWIQYQLDNYSTVEEMIANKEQFRISPVNGKVHYIACDTTPTCAAFEMLNGKMVVSEDIEVLANDTYENSSNHLKKFKGFGGFNNIPSKKDITSLDRFVKASYLVQNFDEGANQLDYGFNILDFVSKHDSRWSILYNLDQQKVNFKTANHPLIKEVDLSTFDFSCKTPRMVVNIQTLMMGNLSNNFTPLTPDLNKSLVYVSLKDVADKMGQEVLAKLSVYPFYLQCDE